jgi:hypothetical protein
MKLRITLHSDIITKYDQQGNYQRTEVGFQGHSRHSANGHQTGGTHSTKARVATATLVVYFIGMVRLETLEIHSDK